MREKRLRKKETGEQLLPSAEAEGSQDQSASGIPKSKVPVKSSPASPEPSVTSSTAPPKLCKLTSLNAESPSPQNRTASPDTTAEASVPEGPASPHPESQSSCREVPDRNTCTSTPQSSTTLSRAAQQAAEVPAGHKPQHQNQTRTPEHPELNKGTDL